MEFGVNTKLVLGLPRAKQLGLKHCKKNLRDCEIFWGVFGCKGHTPSSDLRYGEEDSISPNTQIFALLLFISPLMYPRC